MYVCMYTPWMAVCIGFQVAGLDMVDILLSHMTNNIGDHPLGLSF